ncbi:hypothetical protein D1007_06815 [Hordeum vulgare]|nr:hypothetical protein D1007_06815 [Hordeum vulgare]
MPKIEWDRVNPNLNVGAVYKNMAELRNALTIYCIQSNNVCGTKKNEKQNLTVQCPDPRCSSKLHATGRLCSNEVSVGFGDNEAYQASAAIATATALKAAKATAAAVSASCRISKKSKTKQHWQPRSNRSKRHEFMTSTKGQASVHDQEGEEFLLAACVGFGDDTYFPDTKPFQPREHDSVASATRSNQGATSTPDTSIPEITLVPAKNPTRNKQAKKVVQPMSVLAKNTRSKVVVPSSNTRSKRRV